MKKLIILPLLAVFLVGGSAFAQSTSGNATGTAEVTLPDPGIMPDSAFYFVDSFFDAMKVFFAFGAEAKANANLDIALEKTAEAKAMAENESEEAFERARAKYEARLEKAMENVEELRAENETRAKVAAERVAAVTQAHIDVLISVSADLPEAASDGINTAIEVTTKNRDRLINRLRDNFGDVELNISTSGSMEEDDSMEEDSDASMEAEGEGSMESDDGTSVEVEGDAGIEIGTGNGGEDTSGTQDTTVQNVVVRYTASGYSPASVTVPAGSTVTFTNESSVDMWTASNVHPAHTLYGGTTRSAHCPDSDNSAFDSCESISMGDSWSFTFTKTGSWDYHNHVRANHGGTVIVQ